MPAPKLLLFLLVASCADAAEPDPNSIFAPLVTPSTPGLAVLVRHNGSIVFERGYGVRDLKTHAAIDAKTNFRLASFTKQFTAMSIMLLVHDGKLRYSDSLSSVFPEFPAYAGAVTLRHLLTHTSGLADYEDAMDESRWTSTRQIHDRDVLSLLEKQPALKFAPGTSWSYSNSAYVLLGLIVAKVSGRPFDQFLDERMFTPLHMDHTVAFVNGKNKVAVRAFGHAKNAAGFRETDQSSTSATLGDGGIYSNLEDLAKWEAALENHTLLGEQEMRAALTPVTLNGGGQTHWPSSPGGDNLDPGKPVAYGFGWFLDPYEGHQRMWHTGTTTGFRTVIERFPAARLTVIILLNRTDLEPDQLALRVADQYLGVKR